MKNLLTVCLLGIVLALGLGEAFAQTVWTKDASNPILSGGALGTWNRQVFQPCVLYNTDSARYEMWFGASSYPWTQYWHPYRVGFATSQDGLDWTVYPSAVLSPTPGTWDEYTVGLIMVIRENGQYKMWYTSALNQPPVYPTRIGYATSPDGIQWTKYSGNPIFVAGTAAWEASGPYSCYVMPVSGGYQMWYGGFDASGSKSCIGYATSSDGIAWQRDTVHNPVLQRGAPGQWDDTIVMLPQVWQLDATYYMIYLGISSTDFRNAGLATSDDSGKTWTKYSLNPVLTPTYMTWDATMIEPGAVLLHGNMLDMWYAGLLSPASSNPWRIGHATSPITGISHDAELPQDVMLLQNYPNPFNPSTTIEYELPTQSHVRLAVYNMLGQEVAVLLDELQTAGYKSVEFNALSLPSGVYLYRLQAGEFVAARKFVLLR